MKPLNFKRWSVLLLVIVADNIFSANEVDAIVTLHHTRRKQSVENGKPEMKSWSFNDNEKSFPNKLFLPSTDQGNEITGHPLDPLTLSEIRLVTFMISVFHGHTRWIYKSMSLKEPAKSDLLQFYLKNDDQGASAPGRIFRRVWVLLQDPETYEFYEAIVNLNKLTLEVWRKQENVIEANKPNIITMGDVVRAEDIALGNKDVINRIHALGYNISHVVCDTWDAGYVADNPNYAKSQQLLQIYFYGVDDDEDNFYAHPFDFVAYVDVQAKSVRGLETLPIHLGASKVHPKGNSIPKVHSNYFPRTVSSIKINSSTVMMNVIPSKGKINPIKFHQPGGPSFKIEGMQVTWQNFILRVGYNGREGLLLHHVKYNDNGNVRPLFYRMSLSEIFVMHGDPRPPLFRKTSFDMGEFQLGLTSTELPKDSLCMGEARYLDMVYANEMGQPYVLKNAICISEEDAGPLWAHYDRSTDKVVSARSQRLSIGFLAAIGHTDYWITWRFYQDATIELSIKLTGLKSTNLVGVEVKTPPFGNIMSAQVYSQINQYFFGVRIDADIDSEKNAVVMEDIVPVEGDYGSARNPYGNGIMRRDTLLKTVEQAATNISPRHGRAWKIANLEKLHPLTKTPVSWKLVPKGDSVPLLLKKDSPLRSNTTTGWIDRDVWVLPFDDDQIFASGLWMKGDGLVDWVNADTTGNIVHTDVVLWHVCGLTNIPVAENWPVTSDSRGKTGFILKPNFFFEKNPALD